MAHFNVSFGSWLLFGVIVLASLAVDLIVHRGDHGRGRKAAALWSLVWVALAAAFGGWVALRFGARAAGEYYAAWLLEKSLSIDNLFIFLLIFRRLRIEEGEQHRVLFWGILGALVTRGVFIAAGSSLLEAWHGTLYVMGAFLVFTGVRSATEKSESESRVLRFMSRHLRVTRETHGHHFFTREDGVRSATPLLLALIVIEITDVIFAVDSIPAVLAVTREPYIVYSSNVFAILGLRALYLVLASAVAKLRYLHVGLGIILVLVGIKMLVSSLIEIPVAASLGATAAIMIITVVASLLRPKRSPAPKDPQNRSDSSRWLGRPAPPHA